MLPLYFRILASSPTADALSSEILKKLILGKYLPSNTNRGQMNKSIAGDDTDEHCSPLYQILLNQRNEIAQVRRLL